MSYGVNILEKGIITKVVNPLFMREHRLGVSTEYLYFNKFDYRGDVNGISIFVSKGSIVDVFKRNTDGAFTLIRKYIATNEGENIINFNFSSSIEDGEMIGVRIWEGVPYLNFNLLDIGFNRYDINGTLVQEHNGAISYSLITDYPSENVGVDENEKGKFVINDFKWIQNEPLQIFHDSLFSGILPKYNFNLNIEPSKKYSGRLFEISTSSLGVKNLSLSATDENFNLVSAKEVKMTVVAKPSVKLSSKSKLKVLFIGDSLFHANRNLIGAEFYRVLNTNEEEKIVDNIFL